MTCPTCGQKMKKLAPDLFQCPSAVDEWLAARAAVNAQFTDHTRPVRAEGSG